MDAGDKEKLEGPAPPRDGGAPRPRRGGQDPRGGSKPRSFFYAALLLGVLLGVAAISNDALQSGGVERNFYAVRDLLVAGKLDPSTWEYQLDTRTFRAKLRQPEG